jgi:hypothetical protein
VTDVNVTIDPATIEVVIPPQVPVNVIATPQGEIDVQVVAAPVGVQVTPPAEIGVSVSPPEPVVVTLYQGIPGKDGASAAGELTTVFNFAFGDASPAVLNVATAGKQIFDVEVNLTQPFDGVGASLTIGDAAILDRLMSESQNDPATAGRYQTAPEFVYGGDTQLLLSIIPGEGATTGAGVVAIRVQA